MNTDYFAILGLAPGRYQPAEITERFHAERTRLLAKLHEPGQHAQARQQLDLLHLAYAILREPNGQAEYLQAQRMPDARVAQVRRLIEASLEDGLLRYSRRQEILTEAARHGLSEFQTQLLIAQVQFGDDEIGIGKPVPAPRRRRMNTRAWAQLSAAGLLGLVFFLIAVRWLSGS